jgi:putative transposase
MSPAAHLALVDRADPTLSIVAQCQLLKVARSTLFYRPVPVGVEDLTLMRRMDELHLAYPFYGSRRLAAALRRDGWLVNRKQVKRLMQVMALETIYQKPSTSHPHPDHKVYPYTRHVRNEYPAPCGMARSRPGRDGRSLRGRRRPNAARRTPVTTGACASSTRGRGVTKRYVQNCNRTSAFIPRQPARAIACSSAFCSLTVHSGQVPKSHLSATRPPASTAPTAPGARRQPTHFTLR